MIIGGNSSSSAINTALSGLFDFTKDGDKYSLVVKQLRFDIIKDTTMTISYVSPAKNGMIPPPEPILVVHQ